MRLLVWIKAIALWVVGFFAALGAPLWRAGVLYVALPVYRALYGLKRRLAQFYRPAKNRLMFLITNRYTVHVIVVVLAIVVAGANFHLAEVRAESDTFGQKSILYAMVTKQDVEVIEEYALSADDMVAFATTDYMGGTMLEATPGTEDGVVPAASFSTSPQRALALTAPVSGEAQDSLAPRDRVIAYEVQQGDTLSTISEKFDISLDTLLWSNNLTVRSVIKPGVSLSILPVSGVSHMVKNGDTLSAISKKYSVDSATILSYNNLESADQLKVGSPLIVPGGKIVAPIPTRTTTSVVTLFTNAPAGAGGSTVLAPGARMIWPTDLKYIVRKLSWSHTGWDVDCTGHANGTSTSDNYAAMDGVVQFSGVKKGYGNTVEINHGNGLVTRYGHFYSLYVQKGDSVTAGTPLGRCGSTGISTGTHLHFEVIVNGAFKNPGDYLGY